MRTFQAAWRRGLTCDLRVVDVHPCDPHLIQGLAGAVATCARVFVARACVDVSPREELRHGAEVTVEYKIER